ASARNVGQNRRRRRRNRAVHHAGLSLSGSRCAADQLPFAALDAADAGQRLRGSRAHPGGICGGSAEALPLLQLRRRHASSLNHRRLVDRNRHSIRRLPCQPLGFGLAGSIFSASPRGEVTKGKSKVTNRNTRPANKSARSVQRVFLPIVVFALTYIVAGCLQQAGVPNSTSTDLKRAFWPDSPTLRASAPHAL